MKAFSATQQFSVPFTVHNNKFSLIILGLNHEIWECQLSLGPEAFILSLPI
jgi:hypothetical protein